MPARRDLKDALYAQFARLGHAAASPKRIELLDLLSQGDKTVETLADQSSTPVKNTSAHLRVLRQAGLVETRREGTYVRYRLAGPEVGVFVRSLQHLGRQRLADVQRAATQYLEGRDAMQPVTLAELRRLVRDGEVTVVDVRPRDEYEAGHIPGALSVPVGELTRRLSEIPKRRDVVAYCRGPYCVYSLDAVTLLRKRGYRARRAAEGIPEWRDRGYPVDQGRAPRARRDTPNPAAMMRS
jgi:rhodanese-related sulfurtransferase/DNA-binding transcriptional ArsR family regulator